MRYTFSPHFGLDDKGLAVLHHLTPVDDCPFCHPGDVPAYPTMAVDLPEKRPVPAGAKIVGWTIFLGITMVITGLLALAAKTLWLAVLNG